MARRKDHSPEELKLLMQVAAKKIINIKGLNGLTARALARHIGYTPGTIYNVYRDMDALIMDVNFATLQDLYGYAQWAVGALTGYAAIRALAYAYIDFAKSHERAWRTLFVDTNRSAKNVRLPGYYQSCLNSLFELIEKTLRANTGLAASEAANAARLLWAALHGVTSLMLDGRLNLIGVGDPHAMVDDLLTKYLGLSKQSVEL